MGKFFNIGPQSGEPPKPPTPETVLDDQGNPIGIRGGDGSTLPLPPGMEQDKALTQYGTEIDALRGRLGEASKNPNQDIVDRYYGEMQAPIEGDFYQAANSTAEYLARQGLGSSGINVAAHAGLANNKAALEGQAKKQAINMAIASEKEDILNSFKMGTTEQQLVLQKYGIDVSRIIAQMQIEAQLDALEAQGRGQMIGGALGLAGGYFFGPGGYYGGNMLGHKLDSAEYGDAD